MRIRWTFALGLGVALAGAGLLAGLCAGEIDNDFVPLFDGKDLSGWTNVNCGPDTWTVRDEVIVCSGVPIGELRTVRQYENFILELEWKHLRPRGNAGVFVWSDALPARGQPFMRAIECQVIDGRNSENATSHGDVFAIHGARMTPDRPHPSGWMRCLPSEQRARPAGEWNHYRITCNDGRLKLAVNGKEVSGGYDISPRKGYICLESEGSECHFRNLRIRELPSTSPAPGAVAEIERGFRSLYNGIDLSGWRAPREPNDEAHWEARDWTLVYDGASEAEEKHLWSAESFGDFELMVDWRLTRRPERRAFPVVRPDGSYATGAGGEPLTKEVADAGDSGIYLRGSEKSQVNIWCAPIGSGEVYGYRTDPQQSAEVRTAVTPRTRADNPPGAWNRFLIRMVGETLTVRLNGEAVIEGARLPGVPRRGPIALQHHGDPIQFANVFVRELPAAAE